MKKLLIILILAACVAQADIRQELGVDQKLDYASLEKLGPWDDRNYQVTQADLAILPENDQYVANVPVFFKILARRANPAIKEFYPRSMYQSFLIHYGGLLVDGIWNKQGLGQFYHSGTKYGKLPKDYVQRRAINDNEVILDLNFAEMAVEMKPTDNMIGVAGVNGNGQTMYYTTDGGLTWTHSQDNPGSCCDPTVDWASTVAPIDRVYQADLAGCGFGGCDIRASYSDDNGATWAPMITIDGDTANDKEFIHVDRSTTSPYVDNVYITYHKGNVMQFAKSEDQGVTWSTPLQFTAETTGIGSDITTDAAGNIYYIYPSLTPADGVRLLKSTDGGDTFSAGTTIAPLNGRFDFPLLAMEEREAFIYVSTDIDVNTGDIYVAWTDEADDSTGGTSGPAANNHSWIQVAKSTDDGASWSVCPHPHDATDTLAGTPIDRFHPWLKVGENGVVHIGYYDTRNSADRTGVDFFYNSSTDGCASWGTEIRASTVTSDNIVDGFEWGDYNGLSVVLDKIMMAFTDNRPGQGVAAMIVVGENPKGSPSFTLAADNTDFEVCANDAGNNNTITIDVNQGYDNSVTLSVASAPAYVSSNSFGNPVINPTPGTSTFTFDVDGSGTTGTSVLTIQGVGNEEAPDVGTITKTFDLNIIYSAGVTAATTLTAPANNAVNQLLDLTFSWAADANATSYHLEVSSDVGFGTLLVDETLTGTSFAATGLPSASVLYWRVSTGSGCNGADVVSAVSTFSTTALPGDCAIGFTANESTVFDFESGDQGWTHSALIGTDAWSVSAVNPHSGTQALHADQNPDSDSVIVSPPIVLPTGQAPLTLQFWNEQEMEDKTGGCWDGGLIEISTDGGTSYSPIPGSAMFSDPYDGPATSLFEAEAWCGDPQAYLNSIVDIDVYAGQTVQFRFRAGNDGSIQRAGGWDIDDVKVIGCSVDQAFSIAVDDAAIEVCENDSGVGTNVNVTTDGTFTGQVTLSATTIPGFVSNVAFATNPLATTPGTSALTFDVGTGTVGTHTLVVQGIDAGGTVTSTANINLNYSLPSAATTLSAPADASTGVATNVMFTWSADANATGYHLEVSDSPAFTNILVDQTVVGTSYSASGLAGNTTLYWRVSTQASCNDADVQSAVFSFTTAEVFCAAVPAAIPDNDPAGFDLTLPIGDTRLLDNVIVKVASNHTWPGDLIFTLTHAGTSVIIMDRPGVPATTVGCGSATIEGIDAVFDDASVIPVEDECAATPPAIGGTVQPENPLAAFAGQTFDGNWVLHVSDNANLDTGEITEFCITPISTAVVADPSVSISKTAVITTDNGTAGVADEGDVITFSVSLQNTGNVDLDNIVVTDTMSGVLSCSPATLAPMATATCTDYIYTVSLSDVTAGGSIDNSVTVTADDPSDREVTATANTSTSLVAAVDSMDIASELTSNADEDGSGNVTLGDTLTFTLTVTNTGNTKLTDVVVSNPLLSPSSITCASLLPGETCVLVGTYVISQSDVVSQNLTINASSVSNETGTATPITTVVNVIVVRPPVMVPALSLWSQLLMMLLLVSLAVFMMQRRKA